MSCAIKVLRDGGDELVAAAEFGGLNVSSRPRCRRLPREQQIEEISRGPGRAAWARRLAAQAEAERIGSFGWLPQGGSQLFA